MTGTLLRLRADAYYMPVRDGVWIRTTSGSFTLRGPNTAAWVERLAPLLDRGVQPEQLYASLRPEQVGYVRKLIGALESRQVVRREPDTEDPLLAGVFPQQMEFLRHMTRDAGAALQRVRSAPIAVAGKAGRATVLAAALAETGFADIAVLDGEPDEQLRELAEEYTARDRPLRLTAAPSGLDGRTVVGVFGADETDRAFALADRAAGAGLGAWLGAVRGQAMLLKGQLPGSGTACVRCAWRRLVHSAVAVPASGGLGHTQVALAAAVLAQELFQHVATRELDRLAEGVVVDLTRLSIWRTAVDPDPGCPAAAVHHGDPAPVPRNGRYPEAVFGARCFGPLVSCSPGRYPQLPLAVVRLETNPAGRSAPVAHGDGPLVVAETMADARYEAVLLAVRDAVSGSTGEWLDVGTDGAEAVGRALVRCADTHLGEGWARAESGSGERARARWASLAGNVPEIVLETHACGLWRATVAGRRPWTGFDADHAQERALLAALGAAQLPGEPDAPVPAAGPRHPAAAELDRVCSALGRTARPVTLPPLVSGHLVGVSL